MSTVSHSLSKNTALLAGPIEAPWPFIAIVGRLQVIPPSEDQLTETLPWETNGPLRPPTFSSWAIIAQPVCAVLPESLPSNAGDGSPAPLPLFIGTWPSTQLAPASKEVKKPVGTSAWRTPVELLIR